MEIDELIKVYFGPDEPQVRTGGQGRSMTMARVWCFLTGWTERELDRPGFKGVWDKFLDWPPDVFALCIAILKRSGAYYFSVGRAAAQQCQAQAAGRVEFHGRSVAAPPGAAYKFSRWKDLGAPPHRFPTSRKSGIAFGVAAMFRCSKFRAVRNSS